MSTTDRPLDGITVVTLEHAIAAPLATRQLADLGARVICPGHGRAFPAALLAKLLARLLAKTSRPGG